MSPKSNFPTARLNVLRKRAEFLRARQGAKWGCGSFLLQKFRRKDETQDIRIGFTATKKLGSAVIRNRAKRRLREAVRAKLPLFGEAGCDYVLIARERALTRNYALLLDDLERGLVSLSRKRRDKAGVLKPGASGATPLKDQE